MSEQMQPFADFVKEQSSELKSWWARLIQLAPVFLSLTESIVAIDDAEFKRRGGDPIRASRTLFDPQDLSDPGDGIWQRAAQTPRDLAEELVTVCFRIHEPLRCGLSELLVRAVETEDEGLIDLFHWIAVRAESLTPALMEAELGVSLGALYAAVNHPPSWAQGVPQVTDVSVPAFPVVDAVLFARQEPAEFLTAMLEGLLEEAPEWEVVASQVAPDRALEQDWMVPSEV